MCAGVFVTVNETNLHGRKKTDITRVRAFWQEDDEGTGKDVLPIEPKPSITVKSSPGRFHRYWLISDGRLPGYEAKFADLMSVMVSRYASDPNAKDISRVLRLPGFYHSKYNPAKGLDGTPVLVRLIKPTGNDAPRLTFDAAFKAFGCPEVEAVPGVVAPKSYSEIVPAAKQIFEMKSAIRHAYDYNVRDDWIRVGAHLRQWGQEGFDIWHDWAQEYDDFGETDYNHMVKEWRKWDTSTSHPEGIFIAANAKDWKAPAYSPKEAPLKLVPKMSALQMLQSMATNHILDDLKADMLNQDFVIPRMCLSGTMSLFYAKPNGGKTLFILSQLVEQVRAGKLDPKKVLYINSDDNMGGIEAKTGIAEAHGILMISPDHANKVLNKTRGKGHEIMDRPRIVELIEMLGSEDDAKGTVVVLDTLKKFSDVMSKSSQTSLYKALRMAVANNVTIIMLGHANKHLNNNGNLIFEGVGDVLADIDNAYAIYNLTERDEEKQVIEFRNTKDRGPVVQKQAWSYLKGEHISYTEMMDSLRVIDDADADKERIENIRRELMVKYDEIIDVAKSILEDVESIKKTELLNQICGVTIFSVNRVREALSEGLLAGHCWEIRKEPKENNAQFFSKVGTAKLGYLSGKGV